MAVLRNNPFDRSPISGINGKPLNERQLPEHYPGYRWAVLAIALIAFSCYGTGMVCIGVVLPDLIRELKISGALAGNLTAMYWLPGIIFTLVGGVVADRYGRKKVGTLSLSLIAIGAVIMIVSRSYVELAVARLLMGIGAGLIPPSFTAILPEWFPQEQRGLILGCPIAAYNAAAFLTLLGSSLVSLYGWREYIGYVVVLPSLIGLILAALILKERVKNKEREAKFRWKDVKTCIKNRNIIKGAVYWMMIVGLYSTMNTWYPTFFVDAIGWSLPYAALIVSMNAIAGIPFGPIGGRISDKLGSRKLVLWISALILAFTYMLPVSIRDFYLLVADIILIGVFATLPNGPIIALTVDLAGTSLAGTAIGVIYFGASIGSVWSPILFGALKDITGAWNYSFYMLGIMGLIALIAMTLIKEKGSS